MNTINNNHAPTPHAAGPARSAAPQVAATLLPAGAPVGATVSAYPEGLPEDFGAERLAGRADVGATIDFLRNEQAAIDTEVARAAKRPSAPQTGTEAEAHGMQGVDPQALYDRFVASNGAQGLLDRMLAGEFSPEVFEGAAGQLQLMIMQDAMQARTNFMNMLSNMMKKQDEAVATVVGNMR